MHFNCYLTYHFVNLTQLPYPFFLWLVFSFQFFTIMRHAATDIPMRGSLRTFVRTLREHGPEMGIIWSWDRGIFSITRYFQITHQDGCICIPTDSTCKLPLPVLLCQHLVLSNFFFFIFFVRYNGWEFKVHFPNDYGCWAPFCVFIGPLGFPSLNS